MKTILVVLGAFLLSGCAIVGAPIDPNSPIWARNSSNALKSDIVQQTEHFRFVYTISQNGAEGGYKIEGNGEYVGSSTFSRGIAGGSTFALALAHNGVIVAYEHLPILWQELAKAVTFSKNFNAPAFDQSGITYYIEVRE